MISVSISSSGRTSPVPVSIGIALFVTQVAPRWLRRPIVYVTDLLAVVPSVVFGLWGVLVFSGAIKGFYGEPEEDDVPITKELTEDASTGLTDGLEGIQTAVAGEDGPEASDAEPVAVEKAVCSKCDGNDPD